MMRGTPCLRNQILLYLSISALLYCRDRPSAALVRSRAQMGRASFCCGVFWSCVLMTYHSTGLGTLFYP